MLLRTRYMLCKLARYCGNYQAVELHSVLSAMIPRIRIRQTFRNLAFGDTCKALLTVSPRVDTCTFT